MHADERDTLLSGEKATRPSVLGLEYATARAVGWGWGGWGLACHTCV